MYIIYQQIKAGRPADLSEFEQIAENMLASGADCLVLRMGTGTAVIKA